MGRVDVLLGLQWGDEGKGKIVDVLTPRYETHWGGGVFGAFLPISYNEVSGFNTGVALHVGPLIFGSRSVFGNLIGSSKELNAFVGLRFGNIYQ